MTMSETVSFDTFADREFEQGFLNIISHGSKDNTYKFALARFLLDYSRDKTDAHVDFADIAKYFLEYYWNQICKMKMKHAPQATKKPQIVRIIEKEFPKKYYPDTFREICRKEEYEENIQKCVKRIEKSCFHNVIWRFQRIKVGRATEVRMFFDYRISRKIHDNKRYVDLDYGINLNPDAIEFFRRHNAVLLKAVILEWAKFLEKLNVGLPKLIVKTEGKNMKRGSLTRFRRILNPFFTECFYCGKQLSDGRKTHVEHVIPFDYIAEDDIWNLTLVCRRCNLQKLGALPPKKYIDDLVRRNQDHKERIPQLKKSLTRLDQDFERVVKNHYENAKSHGYMILKSLPLEKIPNT